MVQLQDMELFTRSQFNPILTPNPANEWENWKLYNPGAIYHNGAFHLFYRALGRSRDWGSSIGYAWSEDGENFTRQPEPLLQKEGEREARGLEDPRITQVDDTFYMAYAAFDGQTPRLSIATSQDLKNWTKHGPALTDWSFAQAHGVYTFFGPNGPEEKPKNTEWSKAGAIFSEKINSQYLMLFGEHRVWFAQSSNGLSWQAEQTPFVSPREDDYFDNCFVEMGPPPIKTDQGWLVIYHGINNKAYYRLGLLLLDLANPRKIIARSEKPIFGPETDYELRGIIDIVPGGLEKLQNLNKEEVESYLLDIEKSGAMPKVIFCCGAVPRGDELRIFYGAGDTYICTATASIKELLQTLE